MTPVKENPTSLTSLSTVRVSVSTWKKETLIRYQSGQTATDKVLHQRLLKTLSCPSD